MKQYSWQSIPPLIIIAIAVNILLLSYLAYAKLLPHVNSIGSLFVSQSTYPEISDISKEMSFKELEDYFKKVATEKGGGYAFSLLAVAPIPVNIDMHLLGHTVGDVLYAQEGVRGMQICTQDFRNACSHSIVVGELLKNGESALSGIADICKDAPGGLGAYTMCFHGLGHGVLAYVGYDMPKAVNLCKEASPTKRGREYIECVGGTIMEIVGGGFHNRGLWEKQYAKYAPKSSPLLPCAADYMPEEARSQCYTYLTPHLIRAAGGSLSNPNARDFEKAFRLCDKIPDEQVQNRNVCYAGFGKEFVVLAKGRDVRNIENMTDKELLQVHEWCAFGGNQDATEYCTNSAVSSLYWGGENEPDAAIRFCTLSPNENLSTSCFRNFFGAADYYTKEPTKRENICAKVPTTRKEECQKKLQ